MGSVRRAGREIAVGEACAELLPGSLGLAENTEPPLPPKETCDTPDQRLFDGANGFAITPYLVEQRGIFLQVLSGENRGCHKGLMAF